MLTMGIKVVSLNVQGLNNCAKRKRIFRSIMRMNADIVLLQETHLKSSNLSDIKIPKYQKQYQAPGTSKSKGMAILIANSLRFECFQGENDPLGRFVFVKGRLDGQLYTIGSIYAPNVMQLNFMEETLLKLSQFQEGHVILGGDLNYVVDTSLDRQYFKHSEGKKNKPNY